MSRREFRGGEEVGRARMLRLWNAEQVLVIPRELGGQRVLWCADGQQ